MSIFNQISVKAPGSNVFDLSHTKRMSLDMGHLIPNLCMEVVPGDQFYIQSAAMVRFAAMLAPIMHEVEYYQHYFFVPTRILWQNSEKFFFGGEDGLQEPVYPTFAFTGQFQGASNGTLHDYLGLPVQSTPLTAKQISCVPHAAYQLIWQEYYRDQNLQDPLTLQVNNYLLKDGENTNNELFQLRKRAWGHDYFTSALPFVQKGVEATIPLGSTADINLKEDTGIPSLIREADVAGLPLNTVATDLTGNTSGEFVEDPNLGSRRFILDNSENLLADLATATSATINDLRNAFRLQEFLEKNARGGGRYIESVMAHFGVMSKDSRLNRPEFLGGFKTPVQFSEVLQTSGTLDTSLGDTPQANMAGHGIAAGGSSKAKYYATEHGYIMGICSVRPKTTYQQGFPKHFLKKDKFDFYLPSFAHIGEQAIEGQEIYWSGVDIYDEGAWGYTPRYAEYKFINDSVHGDFRGNLKFWHLGRIFETPPSLNEDFIECVPSKRIFAVEQAETQSLYCLIRHRIKARRKMPYFGNPKGV